MSGFYYFQRNEEVENMVRGRKKKSFNVYDNCLEYDERDSNLSESKSGESAFNELIEGDLEDPKDEEEQDEVSVILPKQICIELTYQNEF